jgi:hypothetical protein
MPCYLFTYHAYASWMPGRQRGYVKRGQGILPPDAHMHRLYTAAMKESAVEFDDDFQRQVIATLLESETPQRFELHFVATDASHVHVLLAWRDQREPLKMRGLVKGSLTRAINREFGRRTWFAENASRKQVTDRRHYDYLTTAYLAKHRGWKWNRTSGYFK